MKKLGGCLKIIGGAVVLLLVLGLVFGGSGSKSSSSSGSSATNQEQQEQAEADTSKSAEPAKEAEPEPEPEPEPVVYQDVDINTLFETLESNAMNAKNTYEGQPVRFSGVLTNIDASGKYFNLGNGDEWSFDSVQCYIKDDETRNYIASVSKGDTITVDGVVTSVGEFLGYSVDVDFVE